MDDLISKILRRILPKPTLVPRFGYTLVDFRGQTSDMMQGDPRLTLAEVRIYKTATDGTWEFDRSEPIHIGQAYSRDPQTGRFIPTRPT